MGLCKGRNVAVQVAQDPNAQDDAQVAAEQADCPLPKRIWMFLDEDRDGNLDDQPAKCREWKWGRTDQGARGANILVRTLDDPNVDERVPLKLGWHGEGNVPEDGAWQADLKADAPARIRIFRLQNDTAENCVHGPGKTGAYRIHRDEVCAGHLRNGQSVVIYMEAVDYPASENEDQWRVKLTLTFRYNGQSHDQVVEVRIAPWIMASDLDRNEKLYIMDFSQQNQLKNGNYKVLNGTLMNDLQARAGNLEIQRVTVASKLRYLRDVMRFGTHTAAASDASCYRVVLRGNNSKTTFQIPKTGIRRADDRIGYIERGNTKETDLETGGNMVVSPPVQDYPFGRIICGSIEKGGIADWKRFFKANQIQDPLEIDTSWLLVGHSDEIVAFVPVVAGAAAGGANFRMLITSPRRAYEILKDAQVNLTELSGQHMDAEQEEIDAQRTWTAQLAEKARGNAPVDFQQFAQTRNLARPIADGNGRLAFHRFDNRGNSNQFWIHQFFLGDPLLNRLAQWPQGGRERLRVAGARYLHSLLESERGGIIGRLISPIQDTYQPYVDKAQANINNPQQWTNLQQNRLKGFLNRVIRELKRQVPLPQENLGKIHTIEIRGIHDPAKARVFLQRAGSDLFADFPSDASFRATCAELLNALDGITASLPSPTPVHPGEPGIAAIENKLLEHYRTKIANIQIQEVDGLLHANLILQIKLDKIKAFILRGLSADTDVAIPVPVLYHAAVGAQTLVADMINFVQLTQPAADARARSAGCTCVIPKPYGPVVGGHDLFQDEFQRVLDGLGITANFIDDWYEYHLDGGEIHCGTNQLPARLARKWWEKNPALVVPPLLSDSLGSPARAE
jgi:hypothetical protein